MTRVCEGRFWTGPRRGEKCYHPATWHAHTLSADLYVCGFHVRAYTRVWRLADLDPGVKP